MSLLKFGISACLLGDEVRYDGAHKQQKGMLKQLEGNAELVGFCPEVAAGMGIPREPIQLVQGADQIRVLQVTDPSREFTQPLREVASEFVSSGKVHGYIFKARSPSCGVGTTPVWNENGYQLGVGDGEFVAKLKQLLPRLPLIDEIQWQDDQLRADFFAAALNYRDHILPGKK